MFSGRYMEFAKKSGVIRHNGAADGFSESPTHSHFSELGPLVDFRTGNAIASSRVAKLPSEYRMSVFVLRASIVQNFGDPSRSDGKPVKIISLTNSPDCSLLTTFPPAFSSHHAFQVSREQNTGIFHSPP